MFYSQFILAKKGPLGTIWIAAHLERKLRKNQVADTDIGVSVDSILSPDVPIALRLSSHLLLGVVRIYNRKVNYLFDDCSEALLKVKQAFRSAAVDLPPEESKAPYHSITLPETFDLDDFELPDNDIFHGNFVDHHISSREQITLQDTLDGVTYSTSKFGLDERFGDGDASGLDLDEELFLDKVDVAGLTNERSDPQSSVGPVTPVKHNEHPEIRTGNSGTRGVEDDADLMEYAQAPGTPGLVEEPNISNVKEVSACDDHMELENPFGESTLIENAKDNLYGDKQEADLSPQNSKSCDAVPTVEECGHQSGSLDVDSSKLQRKTHVEANSEHVQIEVVSGSRPPSDPVGQDKSVNSSLELADKIIGASRVPDADDVKSGAADGMNSTLPVDESEYHQDLFDTSLENDAREISANCHQDESFPQNRETQVSNEMGDPSSSKLDVHEKVASSENPFIRPCNSRMEQPDFISECDMSADADVQSDVTDLATSGRVEMVMIGKACSRAGNPEEVSKENHIQEHELQEGIGAASDEPNCQVKNASAHYDSLVDNRYSSAEANLSAPEKLLSVPEDVVDQQNMFGEISPGELVGLNASDAGSKVISSKKRSFTENTMTEQSLNAVESSRLVRFKRTIESVPDDDDLLSSILVGRSSVLKVQSTPRPSEAASTKRTRSARRTPKRKVLTDDPMVLHGDMIREQLTNSEDIRRVRKKAPCLQSEISLIEKRYLEEETFLEPLFSGLSIELVSLHSRIWNLRGIQVCNDDPKDSSLENLADLRLPSENAPPENDQVASPQTTAAPVSSPVRANNDDSLTTATEPPSTSLNAKNCETLNVDSDKDSEKHNVAEQNGVTITDVLSSDRDGEMAKTCESPLPTDNGINDVHVMNIEIDACDEQSKLNGDVEADVSNSGPLLGASGPETSDKNDDEEKNAHPVELNSAKIDAEDKLATEDELISRDGEVYSGFETESLVRDDDVLFEVAQETATVEKLSNSKQEELEIDKQNEMHSALFGEKVEYSSYAAAQDYGRSPEHPEAHHHYAMGADNSVYDTHDQEEWKYSAAGNDTDFLNVDDDELNEMPDDHDVHDDEEARFIENTGWSSRTRAVSKYLQTLFIKEAEQGRKSLSLENLLVGKSRKEASRMFFEILVLKTRDYIHVEQRNPFDEIAMKPQTRLMKSHF